MLWARVTSLMRSLIRRARLESDMADEVQFHLETRTEELMSRRSISREEAMRQARIEFGGIERYREEGREARGLRFFDELHADLRYGFRQLVHNRTFTLAAVLILAIGIGGNVAVFSQINDALLKMLPVHRPEELRQLGWTSPNAGFRRSGNSLNAPEGYDTSFSYPAYLHLRDHTAAFSDLFCLTFQASVNVGIQGRAEAAMGMHVSGNYFQGLGVSTLLGRAITPEDDRSDGSAPVAVLSYEFWQRVFNGDPAVVGRTVVVNAVPVTIIGVTPQDFHSIDSRWRPDLMLPMNLQSAFAGARDLRNAGDWTYLVFGRLRPGVTDAQARTESEVLLNQAILANPPGRNYDAPKVGLIAAGRGFSRALEFPRFRLLAGVMGFILLIACANIGGLLLARGTARHREIGTRLALGGSRGRLIRQLLTESVLLSALGGTVGVAAVFAMPELAPQPDIRVLVFSIAITVLAGIVFGAAPAVRTTRVELFAMLKQSGAHLQARRLRFRSGKVFVTAQVALSLLLLVGAGLFSRTFLNLRSQDLGFNPENLLTFQMDPFLNGYRGGRLRSLYEDTLKRLESLPGVRSASISRWGVLSFASSGESVCIPGRDSTRTGAATHNVTPRYFETMGIPLLYGRDIQWEDREGAPAVAVVNEEFVNRYYQAKNPIGESFRMDCRQGPGREVRIVGVVANAKYAQIRQNPPQTVYVAYMQGNERSMAVAVRTTDDPVSFVEPVRKAIREIDPNLPIYEVRTQQERIATSMEQERVFAGLLLSGGIVSLILACIGIYGTLTYLVNRRISDIGLRMALGARARDVIRLIVLESLTPVVTGLGLGLAAALVLTRFVESLLFRISPRDPMTLAAAAIFLLITAALAAFLPARRAAHIDPMTALRYN